MQKRLFTKIFISLLIFIPLMSSFVYATTFGDVESDNPFSSYIDNLAIREIVGGYTDGTYRPNNAVTRGEMSKFVVKAFNLESAYSKNNFNDVSDESKFYEYIITLSNLEIVSGYTDGTFKENNIVTRGEAMKFIVNAIRLKDPELFTKSTEIIIFTDVDSENVFFDYINSSASIELEDESRIINGYKTGVFGVHDAITRAQMAKIISQTIEYYENGGIYAPPKSNIDFNDTSGEFIDTSNFLTLAVYEVNDSNISELSNTLGQDSDKHEEIWDTVTNLIPSRWRENVSQFVIFTDGSDNAIAAVYRDINNLDKFALTVDINDIYDDEGELNSDLLEYALIHELGHLVTLDISQVTVTENIYNLETDEAIIKLRDTAALLCQNYYTFDGCTEEDSYINQFVYGFWTSDQFDELDEIYAENPSEDWEQLIMDFYTKYEDYFVSTYSATHPDEDIAESFAYFILHEEPNLADIKDEKILFFYDFSELVELREDIRENL